MLTRPTAAAEQTIVHSPELLAQLQQEVSRNPDDLAAGLQLGSLLYRCGDPGGSARALGTVLERRPDHPQALLLLARAQAKSGRPALALETFGRARAADPANPQGWQVSAALAADLRDWAELLRIAEAWTRIHPEASAAWQALSRAHFEQSRFDAAIAAFDRVLELEPAVASHRISAARLAIAGQLFDEAARQLERARALDPDAGELHYTACRLHHLTGALERAEADCLAAIAARPGFAPAWVELGTLREGRLDDDELSAVRRLLANPGVHPEHRTLLGFTLGDALDRRDDPDGAFDAWTAANEIGQRISTQEGFHYRPADTDAERALTEAIFAAPIETVPAETARGPRPVFVVGMPRSGTTLIESILASHSTVHGAGELLTLQTLFDELLVHARAHGVDAARTLIGDRASVWRARYLAALPPCDDALHVVDKQPLNFRCIGLLRTLFPEAPVLLARRPPLDVGLSIYRHKFAKTWPCAHRLEHIGHYQGFHERIIDFWMRGHPDAIHVVDHGAITAQPEREIRRLLAFAGLAFEPACLTPHRTARPIATFSAVQVRQPISTSFAGRAMRYRERLAPLIEALDGAG